MNKEENANRSQRPALGVFGKIYYPLLAIAAVLLLVFSFVTYYTSTASTNAGFDTSAASANAEALAASERNSWFIETGSSSDKAVDMIDGWLADIDGLTETTSRRLYDTIGKTDGEDMDITADFADGMTAAYTWQDFSAPDIDYILDNDTVYAMTGGDYAGQEGTVYAGKQPNNLVIVIPGSDTKSASDASGYGDAVLFTTHYDSDSGSNGYGAASAVAAMVSVVDDIVSSGESYKNDLVFVVTDGRYESGMGIYSFLYQFVGFGNVADRIGAAFNFDALTSDGTLTVVGTSEYDSGIMGAYMASGATARADTSVLGFIEDSLSSDMNAFYHEDTETWEFPAINIMVTGGSYSETSPATEAAETAWKNSNVTAQFAAEMSAIAEYFGGVDLSTLESVTNAAAYSWLGVTGIATGPAVYVMSAVLVVMIVAAFLLAAKTKSFSVGCALKGLGGVVLTIAFSLAAFAAAYFVLGSLMAALGVITMNMLTTAQMMSPALIAPAIVFAVAASCGLYPIIKRGFKAKAADCVRGGAILLAVIGAAFGFIYPQAALPFVITGMALMAVMILSTLLKAPFKNKFGFGMERLFLYTIPAMFALPFIVQAIFMVGTFAATVSVIFLMLAVTLLLSSITPYFDYLQPVLTDAFDKLPKHTIPVVETVTEEVEDAAKKGRFTTVTEERVVKHKVAWRYHNWFGVLVITLVAIVAILVSCSLGAYANIDFSRNRTSDYGYAAANIFDSVFDNAIVCYIDGSAGATGNYSWRVRDEAVYRNIKYLGDEDYDYWNWERDDKFGGEYRMDVKTDNTDNGANEILTKPDNTPDGYEVVNIAPLDASSSQMKLLVSGLSSGDTITIYDGSHTENPSGIDESDVIYNITFKSAADEVEIILPFGQGECTMYVETSASVGVNGYCYSITDNPTMSRANTEFSTLSRGFEAEFGYALRYAEIIYDTAS